jgi:hypothetical protein
VPGRDELLVSRMAGAGAISLDKNNTPEFGAGSHTVNRVFGATRNPYDLRRSAGGSSGGAVAARTVCPGPGYRCSPVALAQPSRSICSCMKSAQRLADSSVGWL